MLDQKVKSVVAKHHLVVKEIDCDPEYADTANFCEKYGYSPDISANTIVVINKKNLAEMVICVVLANSRLDVNKKVCELMGTKKASFASAEQTIEATGMMIGGVVAIGVEKLPIYIDSAVMDCKEVIMGGGNRSSKIVLDPKELLKLPNAKVTLGLGIPR